MLTPEHLPTLSREALLALVAELQRQLTALHAEIDELKRGGKRQAAPFSKGARVAEPKPPGRKPGTGTFRYREAPPPETVTEAPVDVTVTQDACPACGGPLAETRVDLASTTDIPERPRPQVTRYRMGVCRCTVCGHQVRGHHPDVAPDQYGVTAHRLGPRVMAATVYQVRPRHRHEAVQEVIPPDYAELMVTDRRRSDDAHAFDGVAQHKCLAHILRSISEVVATKSGRARDFGEPLKGLLQEALALWHAHHGGRVTDFKVEAESEPLKPPLIPWGTYTLGPETAGELLRHLNPRLAILKHYRDNLAPPATTEIIVLRRRGDKE